MTGTLILIPFEITTIDSRPNRQSADFLCERTIKISGFNFKSELKP